MGDFVHLHLHTEFSLLDGAARIDKVVKKAKELGMPAIAMTDHGNMYGAISMFDECQKQGIKAIFGCEFYVCDDINIKSGKPKLHHLILLVKNEEGYKNISMLNTIAFRDGMYYKPRIDYSILKQYCSGLVCLSACVAGDLPQLLLKGFYDDADKYVENMKEMFGEDFYIEVQDHGIADEKVVYPLLVQMAKKHNVKMVATNDVHYIEKEDSVAQDVLMCVQMQKTINDPDRLKFDTDEFYLKSEDEMRALFPDNLEAITNTIEIANKCNFQFDYGHYLYPKYIPTDGSTPMEFMRKLINKGVEKKYPNPTKEVFDRIEYELGVISKLGYIEYYLIVWDYINAAREMGISVGPGRGSGAGSIVAYLIGITDIDPLKYGLFFERFLNPERVSAPDFDVDFEDSRREEVVEYVKNKYGEDHVCRIIIFGSMAAKNAIKDVGRVLQVPYSETDRITKAIPNSIKRPNILEKAFGFYKANPKDSDYGVDYSIPELVEIYNSNPDLKQVVDLAIKLEDMPRQAGIHACGVIIGGQPLEQVIPLAKNGDDISSQYVGGQLEHIGLLKMDFLGLRNLSDIELAKKYIKQNHGVDVDFEKSAYDDAKVFQLISTGNTKAIFQLESEGFQKFCKELQPTCLEDIVAGVSLYRPGPMGDIPVFVHNKRNPKDITYVDPRLEPVLNNTYGCIVYQEQVMKIVQVLAGYTLARADSVRKMMGKKKVKDIQIEREVFIHGCETTEKQSGVLGALKMGVPEDVANALWDKMEKFGQYAFNKSHAAAYSMITYQTAYLKCYYEPEFLTAVLNNRITNIDEVKNYVTYARSEGIEILPPDINLSYTGFTVKDGKIRFGLSALKNVGVSVIDSIIAEREKNGQFKDFMDFAKRVDSQALNKRCLESLIYSGAFDCFGKYRSQLIQVYEMVVDRVSKDRKNKDSGQFSLFDDAMFSTANNFDEIQYPNIKEYNKDAFLKFEKESVGVYISGSPLDDYLDYYKEFNFTSDMLEQSEQDGEQLDYEDDQVDTGLVDNMSVVCGGLVTAIKKIITKSNNKEMGILTIEDLYGTFDSMIFANNFSKYKNVLKEDQFVKIIGKLSLREGQNPVIIAEKILFPDIQTEQNEQIEQKQEKLYLRFDVKDKSLYDGIDKILTSYVGDCPVVIKDEGSGSVFMFKNRNVKINDSLINELIGKLGEKNVIVR